jgi:DNA (cytosine-5)-methyltransferase 1
VTAPTMAEVRRRTGTNGLTVASLFAGAGGSSLGYRLAGFRVAYANERAAVAADAYDLNKHEATVLDRRSVVDVTGEDILAAAEGSLDVLDGSPPCQDFSTAGKRDLEGDNASLYYEFIRLVGEVLPRAFCAENVTGLVKGEARWRHFRPILAELRAHGYDVASRVLDASRLGCPQARERVILIGFRRDEHLDPGAAFPARGSITRMRDAIPHISRLVREPHKGTARQLHWREERTWHASRPAPTLMASGIGQTSHEWILAEERDTETRRPLTRKELAALSTFPADFKLPKGATDDEAWRMFGNSVPPLMCFAWAGCVAKCLDGARSHRSVRAVNASVSQPGRSQRVHRRAPRQGSRRQATS